MTSKENFITEIERLINNGMVLSAEAQEYFNSLKVSAEKPLITEKGIEILQAMQNEMDIHNNLFKASDIGEIIGKPAKAVSGSLRKLVTDGFVEKIGEKPIVYALTEKGKTFEVEK